MKVRLGFVSNSSSSSFVIAKDKMTPTQIEKFGDWLAEYQKDCYEGWIFDEKHYFHGEISMHANVSKIIKELGIDTEYVSITC